MIPKLSFLKCLGYTVLMAIGHSTVMAGGHPGGQHHSGMNAKLPSNVHRIVPAQQSTTKGHNIGTQSSKIQVTAGNQRKSGGITLRTPVSGNLPGTLIKQSSGTGTGARTKPSPLNPGVFKPPFGGGTVPPIIGGGTTSGGGGTTPPSGGGTTTPPAGGGPTNPPTGGGTTPPANNHCHNHFPNWCWLPPTLYPRCGTVYGGYYGPVCSPIVNVTPAPVIVSAPTVIALEESGVATAERLTLQLGESYSLKNENFGDEAGQIVLELNGLMLPALVTSWDAETIAFTLPALGLNRCSDGVLQVQKADQATIKSVAVTVIAAQK